MVYNMQYLRELLAYLDHQKITVHGGEGYSDEDKESMLLSKMTENGIRITSKH